eukprot:15471953-Alexandrium_andersonii.AAC.1
MASRCVPSARRWPSHLCNGAGVALRLGRASAAGRGTGATARRPAGTRGAGRRAGQVGSTSRARTGTTARRTRGSTRTSVRRCPSA